MELYGETQDAINTLVFCCLNVVRELNQLNALSETLPISFFPDFYASEFDEENYQKTCLTYDYVDSIFIALRFVKEQNEQIRQLFERKRLTRNVLANQIKNFCINM